MGPKRHRGGLRIGKDGRNPAPAPEKNDNDGPVRGSGGGEYRGGLRVGKGGRNPRPAAPSASPSRPASPTRTASAPVSAAAQAKADRAKASARRYAEVQRAANKAKRAVLSRKGPQDLAGREQRKMDLKRYRDLQKGAGSWKDKARGQGLRFGGDKPSGNKMSNPAPNTPQGASTDGRRGANYGGSTAAGKAVSKATSGSGFAGTSGGSAPKVGAVVSRARKMKKETTGTLITAKELKSFMAYYDKTHKGTLSRSDAVMLARMLKSKSPKVAKRYGLNVSLEG